SKKNWLNAQSDRTTKRASYEISPCDGRDFSKCLLKIRIIAGFVTSKFIMVTMQDFVRVCVAVTLIHALLVCALGEYPSYEGLPPIEIPDEKKIIRDLLLLYEKRGIDGRPVRNSSMPVSVKFSIQLIQIMDLDEKNQILKLSVWDRYAWKDEFLVWDPAQYGGVTNVRIHQDKVWKPDFKLYNYADERTEEHREALVVVKSTGAIVWMPQVIYKSSCAIDISHFPFDEQECVLKFGSWTYDGNKLDVNFLDNLTKIDLSEYMPSNAWEIIEAPARRNVQYYTCCPEPYLDLTFTLKVRRRSAFYNYLLILPCILLSTLTLVLFWIPPESPAKMALGINIFVAFFLLLVILESSLPSASTVPLLGIYYCFNMVIITLSSFLNVLVVNMAFYGPRGEVPQFLKTLAFEIFARIFFMNRLVGNVTESDTQTKTSSENPSRTTANGNHFVGVDSETNWLADGWREAHEASKSIISGGPGGHSHMPGSCGRALHHRGGHGPGIYHTGGSSSGGRSHGSGGVYQGAGCASGGHAHGGHAHGSHAHTPSHTHAGGHGHTHSHGGGGRLKITAGVTPDYF
ncbi:neuronal acetylcholine receptor subunit beta-3-like isoform X2, partial [Octopus vulgaris]